MMETTFTWMEMGGKDGRRDVTPLADSSEHRRIQREHVLQGKLNIVKSAILEVTGKQWNPRLDSLNTRHFLDNIEIKGNRKSVWYDGKEVYVKDSISGNIG